MGAQVAATQARIDRYAAFARDLHKLVGEKERMPERGDGDDVARRHAWLIWIDRLADGAGTRAVRGHATVGGRVADLIEKADAANECRKLGDEARQIGLAQERTLARCRMAVRWVREQAKMAAADQAGGQEKLELAKTVQARAEEVLYAK